MAEELLPSVTARLELNQVRGFVTERGGKFSHSSILARSMGTPAVAGVAEAPRVIKTGDQVIVDGVSGLVFVNPEPSVETEYERLDGEFRAYKNGLQQIVSLPSATADGTSTVLLANVNKFADTEAAFLYQADGSRLPNRVRLLIPSAFPAEDEQYEFLEVAAERLHPRPLTLRLLDIGAKAAPVLSVTFVAQPIALSAGRTAAAQAPRGAEDPSVPFCE